MTTPSSHFRPQTPTMKHASVGGTTIQQRYRSTCAVAPPHRGRTLHQQCFADRLEVGNAVETMVVACACSDEKPCRRRHVFGRKIPKILFLIVRIRHIAKPELPADDVIVGFFRLNGPSLGWDQPDSQRHFADGETNGETKGNVEHASLSNNAYGLV